MSFNAFWLWNLALDFLGVKFSSREFFGLWFLPPFDHPCDLKSGVPPPPPREQGEGLTNETLSVERLYFI